MLPFAPRPKSGRRTSDRFGLPPTLLGFDPGSKKDIYPALGNLPVSQLSSEFILVALRKIEKRGAIETAKRVRGYVLGVLKRARAEGLVSTELIVSVEIIGDALRPSPPGIKHPALTRIPQLIEFQRRIDVSTGSSQSQLASRLLALTAVRMGVMRTARWDEFEGIDWIDPNSPSPAAIWRIPADRMKLPVTVTTFRYPGRQSRLCGPSVS